MPYKKITGIYMIKCKINNKVYIGQSKNIKDRWKQHKKELRNNKHDNKNIQKDWNKYGEDCFEFNIIVECEKHKLNELERKYINEYKSCDFGYNMTFGKDENGAEIYTEETKKKMSKNHSDFSGSKNPKANMVICIYPDGTQTEPMCIKELAEYLGLDRGIVGRIIDNSEIYHPRFKRHKHLEGIKIIKVEEGLF